MRRARNVRVQALALCKSIAAFHDLRFMKTSLSQEGEPVRPACPVQFYVQKENAMRNKTFIAVLEFIRHRRDDLRFVYGYWRGYVPLRSRRSGQER